MRRVHAAWRFAATALVLACALAACHGGSGGSSAPAADEPAALPSFPGAEGFGATTPGGRGGRVIEVTTLAAQGPGSLREALEASAPRIVVFEVGGTIDLGGERILVTSPYLTVAGQSALGDGIMIRNGEITIATHDVIIRGLRIRVGDLPANGPSQELRGIMIAGPDAHDIVIDHCSISWGRGGNLYVRDGAWNVTFSWNIVAEALRIEGSKGITHHSTAGGAICSHHNVLVSNNDRNPRLAAPRNLVQNNYVYNYGDHGARIWLMPGFEADLRGNAFVPGPDSAGKGIFIELADNPRTGETGTAPGTVFLEANLGPGREVITTTEPAEEWLAVDHDPGITTQVLVATPFVPSSGVTLDPVEELENLLLSPSGAGAIVPYRDAVDERLIGEIRAGGGQVITSQDEVGGWPVLAGGPAPPDSDDDGMPDAWELAHGLDPLDPSDAGADPQGDGYTAIEEYLNGLIPSP